METLGPVNKQALLSETSPGKQLSMEESCENSHSNNSPLIPPQPYNVEGPVNEQALHSEMSPGNKPSMEESCENSHSNNSLLIPLQPCNVEGPVNEQALHSDTFPGNNPSMEESCENSHSNNSPLIPPQPCNVEGPASNSTGNDDVAKKALYNFGQRTSKYRGVAIHKSTGKYEAHLWDNSAINEGRVGKKRKGKQVYLGGYETAEKAARAYDLAALKYWGQGANTKLNFPLSNYEKEIEEMNNMLREEYISSLRRKSIGFTRGQSIYRGVTRQNEGRRWQARIGRVAGGKDIYLGTYDTQEEAAEAYDIAAVKLRGMNAVTNFDISNYYKEGSKELAVIPINFAEEESSTVKRFKVYTT